MRRLVLCIVGGVYEQIALWRNVHVYDWTAELEIIASNVSCSSLRNPLLLILPILPTYGKTRMPSNWNQCTGRVIWIHKALNRFHLEHLCKKGTRPLKELSLILSLNTTCNWEFNMSTLTTCHLDDQRWSYLDTNWLCDIYSYFPSFIHPPSITFNGGSFLLNIG